MWQINNPCVVSMCACALLYVHGGTHPATPCYSTMRRDTCNPTVGVVTASVPVPTVCVPPGWLTRLIMLSTSSSPSIHPFYFIQGIHVTSSRHIACCSPGEPKEFEHRSYSSYFTHSWIEAKGWVRNVKETSRTVPRVSIYQISKLIKTVNQIWITRIAGKHLFSGSASFVISYSFR
jgi:hypothetical protein